jgi:hypothetical protein
MVVEAAGPEQAGVTCGICHNDHLQSVGELDSCFHRSAGSFIMHRATPMASCTSSFYLSETGVHVTMWWPRHLHRARLLLLVLQVLLPLHPAMEPDRVAVPLLQGALRTAAAPTAVCGGTGGARFSTGLPGRQSLGGTAQQADLQRCAVYHVSYDCAVNIESGAACLLACLRTCAMVASPCRPAKLAV